MAELLRQIQEAVRSDSYLVGEPASERLEERGILEWQAVAGLDDADLIEERPDGRPNPSVRVREMLPDGTEFVAVWAWLPRAGVAKLVTVFFEE